MEKISKEQIKQIEKNFGCDVKMSDDGYVASIRPMNSYTILRLSDIIFVDKINMRILSVEYNGTIRLSQGFRKKDVIYH